MGVDRGASFTSADTYAASAAALLMPAPVAAIPHLAIAFNRLRLRDAPGVWAALWMAGLSAIPYVKIWANGRQVVRGAAALHQGSKRNNAVRTVSSGSAERTTSAA